MQNASTPDQQGSAEPLAELQLLNSLLTGMVHTKNQFLTAMGLRLRSPLTTLVGYTEMLAAGEVPDPADQRMVYDELLAAGQQLLDLVNDVIEFSRVDAGNVRLQRAEIDLAEVLRETLYHLEPLAGSRRQHLVVDLPPAPPLAFADRRWMTQIAIKLGINALRFSPTGSTVTLRARTTDATHVVLEVVDEGVGIRPEEGDSIFHPFHEAPRATREDPGTGMELPLVKRLIALQDGTITYRSARGVGTTFIVTLPAGSDASPQRG